MWWRLLIGFIAIVVTLAVLWALEDREAQSEPGSYCVDEKTRHSIREMALDSFDDAFKKHIGHLFDIWVKDPAEQPKRASRGMQAAIGAYVRARQDALKWEPTICEP
jgi:hypothetical protein